MAILNHLATKDAVGKYVAISNAFCPLCDDEEESRDHLFFRSSYSAAVLRKVMALLCFPMISEAFQD